MKRSSAMQSDFQMIFCSTERAGVARLKLRRDFKRDSLRKEGCYAFKIAICDLKGRTWATSQISTLRLHRTRGHYGGDCSEQPSGRDNEPLRRPSLHSDAGTNRCQCRGLEAVG